MVRLHPAIDDLAVTIGLALPLEIRLIHSASPQWLSFILTYPTAVIAAKPQIITTEAVRQ